jgi:hypothetical protein
MLEDEGTARAVVEALVRSRGSIVAHGIDLFNIRRFRVAFRENRDLLGQLDGLNIRESERGPDSVAEDDQQVQTTVVQGAGGRRNCL